MKILTDTREQRALHFDIGGIVTDVSVATLPVGDYWCEYADGSRPPVFFERKSLGDLFGTMTSGYQRFKREMTLAARNGWKLVLLVEASLTDVYGGCSHSSMTGQTCVQKVHTLWARHGLAPLFCQDRTEAAAVIVETYAAIGRCWKVGGQQPHDLFGGIQLPLTEANVDD